MSENSRRVTLAATAAGLLATALVLGGCSTSDGGGAAAPSGGQSADSQTLDDLYQQAIDNGETTITVYGPGEAQLEAVYAEFSKRFPGIEVHGEFLFGGELEARLQQESATGQHVGDLVHFDDAIRYHDIMVPFDIVGVDDVPDDVSLYDGRLYVTTRALFGFGYNEDKLAEADVPTTWEGVVADDFDAVVGMSDPTSLATTSTVLYTAYKAGVVDDDWFEKLAARKPAIFQSTSQTVAALASGEVDFMPVTYYGYVLTQRAQGANIGFVIPDDGVVLQDAPYGLLDGAPSPTASQLLVSWLLSEEGQTALADKVSEYGTMPGAPAPAGLPAADELTVFEPLPVEDRIAFKEEAAAFLGTWF